MPVLVTGGAGFIGSHLVDELMVQGCEVIALDDLSEGKTENLKRWEGNKKFTFVKGSILDYDLLKKATDHVSCVFHLAADSRIQTGVSDPRHSIETNVVGTSNVAEACRQNGVSRIVYSASSSAYGRINDTTFGLNERMPTDCLNPYSVSKKAGEDIMDVYHRLYGISTVSLRYFNVYGPRHQEEGRYATVIAIFRKQYRNKKKLTIVGDGDQRRDFTFIGDVVKANMLAMMNREATGVFNIGTGKNHSINDIAEKVIGLPAHTEYWHEYTEYIAERLGEARITLADNTKAKNVLGWKPSVSLEQGLEVIDMYEKKMGFSSSGIILL